MVSPSLAVAAPVLSRCGCTALLRGGRVCPYSVPVKDVSAPTRHVLIAEDDDHMREALQEMLREAGYRVITAEDGLEALDWLARVPVDLVIVDILMPGLGGPELIRRIRESSQWAAVPIMVLSGYADLTRYRDLPVDDIQLKPFKLSEFLEKVQKLIGSRA
jgi:DNA-binding response OmpR family regulator